MATSATSVLILTLIYSEGAFYYDLTFRKFEVSPFGRSELTGFEALTAPAVARAYAVVEAVHRGESTLCHSVREASSTPAVALPCSCRGHAAQGPGSEGDPSEECAQEERVEGEATVAAGGPAACCHIGYRWARGMLLCVVIIGCNTGSVWRGDVTC